MGLWKKLRDSWRESKRREEEAKNAAAIDEYMRGREIDQREQTLSPRIPTRLDRDER